MQPIEIPLLFVKVFYTNQYFKLEFFILQHDDMIILQKQQNSIANSQREIDVQNTQKLILVQSISTTFIHTAIFWHWIYIHKAIILIVCIQQLW